MNLQSNYFSGRPVITQILDFIPRNLVYRTADRHKADRYCKHFKTFDHLVALLFGVLSHATSLRELSTAMLACQGKIGHLGLSRFPKRSTLSDANNRRKPEVFESLYYALLQRYRPFLSDSCRGKAAVENLFIMDATSVLLFTDVLKAGAGRNPLTGKKKGGLKIHTLIQANEDVPCLVNLTSAATNDSRFTQKLHLLPGSWVVFDKAYRSFEFYKDMTEKGVFFVTRLHDNAKYELVGDFDTVTGGPLHKDQLINIVKNHAFICLRRIEWTDEATGKTFQFITNNGDVSAATIAAIYKQRWQIELLFKRLKQNFCLKYFLGDSANAIKIQVWVCLIAHLILKIIQLKAQRRWAYSTLASMARYHLMTYINLFKFLKDPQAAFERLTTKIVRQKSLFPT